MRRTSFKYGRAACTHKNVGINQTVHTAVWNEHCYLYHLSVHKQAYLIKEKLPPITFHGKQHPFNRFHSLRCGTAGKNIAAKDKDTEAELLLSQAQLNQIVQSDSFTKLKRMCALCHRWWKITCMKDSDRTMTLLLYAKTVLIIYGPQRMYSNDFGSLTFPLASLAGWNIWTTTGWIATIDTDIHGLHMMNC